jgi:poly(A) polymerase Pap1
VPVIKFEMDGFEFDLAMARFEGLSHLPEDFDVTDDRYLKHVAHGDMQSITSLNGVRVTGKLNCLPLPPLVSSSLRIPRPATHTQCGPLCE